METDLNTSYGYQSSSNRCVLLLKSVLLSVSMLAYHILGVVLIFTNLYISSLILKIETYRVKFLVFWLASK